MIRRGFSGRARWLGDAMKPAMRAVLWMAALCLAGHGAQAGEPQTTGFPVPSVPIMVGETLSAELIIERQLVANTMAIRTHYTNRDAVVGKVARRPLPAGAAIPLNALRDPVAFKEGDRVSIEYASGGLSIRATAIAVQPGVVGQAVRVRNVDTGAILSGVVRPDGSVEVGG